MAHRAHRLIRCLVVACSAFALAVPVPALAAAGDKMKIGTLDAPAVFADHQTGVQYQLFIRAAQGNGGGGGNTTIGVHGDAMRACSTHGPDIQLSENADGSFGGNNPLQAIQCGTAAGQSVSIEGCVADIEAHGFVHSDHPNVSYLGATTIDLRYQKMRNAADKVKLTIHTPKEKIEIDGTVVSGSAAMTTCP